ncbi:MAG: class I SAM-dependent methyltransferase [Bacteroidetes bacterium]|nr:class I SAM-dependent methyltransferase [Bacteroidota bacterium]
MYEFHGDKRRYFDMTRQVTEEYIIPYLKESFPLSPETRVLEIGCGEAGVLKAFTDLGCQTFGIELEESRLEFARQFMAEELKAGKVQFLNKDIYDVNVQTDIGEAFDLVILKDVIEHIPDQAKFMPQLHKLLKPGGRVFFAFPPWYMPYGGHQQVLPGKAASRLPWYHLLPGPMYPGMLKLLGMPANSIATMLEIRSTGISIQRFEKICRNSGFAIESRRFYLFNPIYKFKFGIRPRLQNKLVAGIPRLRDFFTMGMYYIVKPAEKTA